MYNRYVNKKIRSLFEMKYTKNGVEELKIAYTGGGSRGWAWGLFIFVFIFIA